MVAITGFIGKVDFRFDEDWQGTIWESQVWPTPEQVLDEMVTQKEEVQERILDHCDEFSEYGMEEEDSDENIDAYDNMIAELRAGLKSEGVEDSFEDIEIFIGAKTVHLPQMTEYEWSQVCGKDAAS